MMTRTDRRGIPSVSNPKQERSNPGADRKGDPLRSQVGIEEAG